MTHYTTSGKKLVTPVTVILAILAGIAAVLLAIRFIYGLGAITNLNDGYTWGIWVVIDVVIGTGFACGGFAMAFLVYVFNRGRYHPLVRPALLASLFGYTLGGIGISGTSCGPGWGNRIRRCSRLRCVSPYILA